MNPNNPYRQELPVLHTWRTSGVVISNHNILFTTPPASITLDSSLAREVVVSFTLGVRLSDGSYYSADLTIPGGLKFHFVSNFPPEYVNPIIDHMAYTGAWDTDDTTGQMYFHCVAVRYRRSHITTTEDDVDISIWEDGRRANDTIGFAWLVRDGDLEVKIMPGCHEWERQTLQIWTYAAGNTSEFSLLFSAGGHEDQMWIPQPGESITWSGMDKIRACADLTNGNLTGGNPNADTVDIPTSFVISLKKDHSHCIAASSSAAGAAVVRDPTNDGHIAIFTNLYITPAATAINDGAKLSLAACDPNNTNQNVINSQAVAKLGIDLTNGDETPGNQLQMFTGGIFAVSGDNSNQDCIVTNNFRNSI
ncbi:hypothetical protein C8R44DRAFT_868551 [Mycena epipterygia]|nr:hypothetical protein C8R44DRAFT_868551 [Mycena epipterygia]